MGVGLDLMRKLSWWNWIEVKLKRLVWTSFLNGRKIVCPKLVRPIANSKTKSSLKFELEVEGTSKTK